MKKILALLLAAALAAGFTGCAETSDDSSEKESKNDTSVSEKADDEEGDKKDNVDSAPTEDDGNDGAEDEGDDGDADGGDEPSAAADYSSFEEYVIVDNESCLMKITGIEEDEIWGFTLKAYLENKTADKELMFSMNETTVNGYMCDPFWAKSLTAGTKSNENISFSSSDFEMYGFTDITEISGSVRVYDDNDWLADDIAKEAFTFYPLGEAANKEFIINTDGETLIDNGQCKMILTKTDPDGFWGYTLTVYLENNTDKDITYSIESASVNGFDCDPLWASTVSANKKALSDITWLDSTFEENGITSVDQIVLNIRVYDSNDFMSDDIANETVTLGQ